MFTFVDGSCIHHRRLNASREVFFFLTIFPRRFSFLLNSSPFFLHDPSPSSNLYCLNHTFLFFFFPVFLSHPARPSAKKATTTPPTNHVITHQCATRVVVPSPEIKRSNSSGSFPLFQPPSSTTPNTILFFRQLPCCFSHLSSHPHPPHEERINAPVTNTQPRTARQTCNNAPPQTPLPGEPRRRRVQGRPRELCFHPLGIPVCFALTG